MSAWRPAPGSFSVAALAAAIVLSVSAWGYARGSVERTHTGDAAHRHEVQVLGNVHRVHCLLNATAPAGAGHLPIICLDAGVLRRAMALGLTGTYRAGYVNFDAPVRPEAPAVEDLSGTWLGSD